MRRIVLCLSFMLAWAVCGQVNPFSGIFGEECFRNATEYKQSVVAQYEKLLCEDSPESNPATIRAFVDFFYRGKPIPDTQAADAAGDHWDTLVNLLCLKDQEAPLKELLASGKGTSLFRIQTREMLITLYWEGSKQRKALEQEQLKAIEAAVLEGRWKGRIGYQWYYNYLKAYTSVGRRYWGELETRLRPKAAEIDPWFWEMVQGQAGIFWAWSDRGGGWASSVSEEGWDGFDKRLKSARQHFHKALEIHPDYPNPHVSLITVEMGDGCLEDILREYKACVSISPTNAFATQALTLALLPRWHGSHELIWQLAREAMDCPRRDSDVPLMGYVCLSRIAEDVGGSGWQKVYLTPEVKERAARLFREWEPRLERKEFLRARLWYELSELRYDDAAKTLKELGGPQERRPTPNRSRGDYWRARFTQLNYADYALHIRIFTGEYGEILRNAEIALLNNNRSQLERVHHVLSKKTLPKEEQNYLLEWYGHWMLNRRPGGTLQQNGRLRGAFHIACARGDLDLVTELLDLGYDWQANEAYPGETANFLASKCGDPAPLKILKDAGDPLTRRAPKNGYAPIHHAAAHGSPKVIKALLDYGIDIENRCRDGHTPLQTAAGMRRTSTMEALLKLGANPNAQDGDGDTCLIYLPQLGALPSEYQPLLQDSRTDVNLANHAGDTPLHKMAQWNTSPEIVQMLLAKGGDLNVRNNSGKTPLDVAEASGNAELAKFLQQQGAKHSSELPEADTRKKHTQQNAENAWLRLVPWIVIPVALLAFAVCVVLVCKKARKR